MIYCRQLNFPKEKGGTNKNGAALGGSSISSVRKDSPGQYPRLAWPRSGWKEFPKLCRGLAVAQASQLQKGDISLKVPNVSHQQRVPLQVYRDDASAVHVVTFTNFVPNV